MTVNELLLVGFGLLAAGLVKGLTGIGFSTAALPFLVVAVGLRPAMALVTLPAIVANLVTAAGGGDLGRAVARFWPFYAAMAPGIVVGTVAMSLVDVAAALEVLAIATLAYVGLALARPSLSLPTPAERLLKVPAGWLNGFLTGLTGSQVMPLVPYMMALRLAPDDQVQAVNLAVSLASLVLAVALFAAGVMTPDLVLASAAGSVPAVAGVLIGSAARRWLSPAAFRNLALGTLALVALSLNSRAVTPRAEHECAAPATPGTYAERGAWRSPHAPASN